MRRHLSATQAAALLRTEIAPVVGCTEPASIAFALAEARRQLGREPDLDEVQVELRLSRDVRRNASTAVVPFARRRGLDIVAAAGLLAASRDFNPFLGLNQKRRELKRLIARRGWLKVVTMKQKGLHLTAILRSSGHEVAVTISGRHNAITEMRCDRETVYRARRPAPARISGIEDAARLAHRRSKRLEAIALDLLLSQTDARSERGLAKQVAALIKGRMTGENLPIVTFTGSGNQGIFLALPLRRLFRRHGESTLPAIVFALLAQIHLTEREKRISDSCGIATKAAPALAAGLAFHAGVDLAEVRDIMTEVTRELGGMHCPGALPSCASKARRALQIIQRVLDRHVIPRQCNLA
jgi:L-cysteine desulfidase